jgi:hypothetical protein
MPSNAELCFTLHSAFAVYLKKPSTNLASTEQCCCALASSHFIRAMMHTNRYYMQSMAHANEYRHKASRE